MSPNRSRLAAKPSRLTIGAAAATAVVAAGLAIAVSAGPDPAPGAFSNLAAVSRATSGQAGVRAARPARVIPAVGGIQSVRSPAGGTRPHSRALPAVSGQQRPAAAAVSGPEVAAAQTAATGNRRVPHTGVHGGTAARPAAKVRHAAATGHPHHARLGYWYSIYDSVTPSAIPSHRAVATYATGNYAVSHRQVANRRTVLWIDTTGYDYAASILDVEPGDATPSMAGRWAWHRLHRYPHALARIYTMRSEWPAVKAAVARLPRQMRARIRWWIADPTGRRHLVAGSDATQWYWGHGFDISMAKPRF
ncbi:MAG: hypothetical protein ACYCO9_03630 [Streptosporangiaceae bacterium]